MSIRKRGDKWQIDVRDRALGIRIRRTAGTQREAREMEAQVRQEIKKQQIPNAGIEHALTEYLKSEAKTLKDYKGIISKSKAIRPYIAGQTFESIGLVQAKIKRDMLAQGLKPATINRRLALLRRLANLAFEWGWIDTQIGARIKLLSGETERHFYLSIQQIENLADLCPITGALILIAAMTGLRRTELLTLTEDKIIDKKWIALNTDTKTGRPRLVPIPSPVRQLFGKYHWPLDKSYNQTLRNEFEAARKELNLTHIRFHDLRHSYASFLVQNGAGLQHVGKAMGHSSVQMTNRYAHLLDENLMELAEKFGELSGAQKK
ncbi:site-specific integrase [uncultured Paraglaciecola sp.]|uniref:site-specific integrase n=1 Tax=uncultured Paraglaciecola sp. TaxID=1765024 RepID=UPI00261C405C|nr:site-specific integrase [uncultured Paraglaciecola sp.]